MSSIPAIAKAVEVSEAQCSGESIQDRAKHNNASASNKTGSTAIASIEESEQEEEQAEEGYMYNDNHELVRRSAPFAMPVPPAMQNLPFVPPATTQPPPTMVVQPPPAKMTAANTAGAPDGDQDPRQEQEIEKLPTPCRIKSTGEKIGASVVLVWNLMFRRYAALKIVGILLAIYTAVFSFTYIGTFGKYGGVVDPETGYIIDTKSEENTEAGLVNRSGVKRAVVASTSFELVALAIARMTAFYMYPALVMVFSTKFRATMHWISKTPLSMFTYEDLHELHVFSGWTILINGIAHTVAHIARWISQNNMELLWNHFSGVSGIFITISLFLICFPMLLFKKEVPYEIRKGLHYFFIVFCLGMCFHAPTSALPNGGYATWFFTTVIVWWILDIAYCNFSMTEKIESTIFHVVPTGVQLTMRVSERFQKTGVRGGTCYVNFPWLSRYEWHAFSLFENPANPAERQIFMERLGDWTNKLHATVSRDTSRPIWVQGPFSSPYDHADQYDNQILVAGGIGITPALSVMRAHKSSPRRANLIWSVRDPHMLEFFLRRAEFSARGWNLVFYTGKENIYLGDQSDVITANGARVHIIKARPDFNRLIPNLIYSIDSKTSVPEAYVPDTKIEAVRFLKERLMELDSEGFLDDRDKIRALIQDAESFGFLFTDLALEFFGQDVSTQVQRALNAEEGLVEKRSDDDTEGTSNVEINRPVGEGSSGRKDNSSSIRKSTVEEQQILSSLRKIELHHSVRFFGEQQPSQGSLPPSSSIRTSVRGRGMRRVSVRNPLPYDRWMGDQESSTLSARAWKAVTMAADDWADEHAPSFKPWAADPTKSKKYVNAMDPDVLKAWGMLYCGGKSPLATNASKAASENRLAIYMESFAW